MKEFKVKRGDTCLQVVKHRLQSLDGALLTFINDWIPPIPPPPSTESKLSKISPPISIPTRKPMQDTCTSSINNEANLYIQYYIATTTSRSIQNKKYFKSMCRKSFQKDIV